MSGLPPSSTFSDAWSRPVGPTTTNPLMRTPIPQLGVSPIGLPAVNNLNIPSTTIQTIGNLPANIPQPPYTPFPSIPLSLGPTNSFGSNNYAAIPTAPSFNPYAASVVQNTMRNIQNEAYNRRLNQLEDETSIRQNTTLNLQQMGTQILQGQTDIQDQVLQYQFMLTQCMETLEHQDFILSGQAEELALLRTRMGHFDYLLDAIKVSKETNQLPQNTSENSNLMDENLCYSRNHFTRPLHAPSTSPFLRGGVTRTVSSKFQPFNSRYRSPNSRNSNLNQSGRMTPSTPNTIARLSRPISNLHN